jgi:hypothetical protein
MSTRTVCETLRSVSSRSRAVIAGGAPVGFVAPAGATEGPGAGCIIEYSDDGTVLRKVELTEEQLMAELADDTWDNPFPSWVGKNVQRLTHEEKSK